MQVDLYHYNEGTFATIVATPSHSNEDKLVPSNEISHISNFKAMRTALRAKKKYGFVDGTIKQPIENAPEIEDWWTINSMLVSWVFNTIEPKLRSTISHMEIVKDLWDDIRERFSISNRHRSNKRMRIVTRTKEERGNPMSFAMKTGGRNSREEEKDRNVVCTNCKREGHDANTCFQLIRYPKWWGNRPRKNVSGRGGGRKHGAHGGHDKGGIAQANAATTNDANKKGIVGLNDEQWATLMGMLSAHKTGTNERLMGPKYEEGDWSGRMGHPSSKVLGLIPEVKPSYQSVRIFGCLCYSHNLNRDKDKFASQSRKGIFVGYPFDKKGWRLYELEIGEYFVSRDVVFVETDFPFADKDVTTDDLNVYRTHNWSAGIEVDCDEGELTNADVSAEERNLEDDVVEEDNTVEESLGRGQQVKVSSIHLKDYVTHTIKSALEDNGTWIVVNLPPGKKAIRNKWVYKIKYHSDGSVERCKNLHQMDVQNAFLHGDLDEEVYMKMPPDFASSSSEKMNILVYIDDLIILGTDEVAWNSEGLFLCQRKYALDIISKTGLLGAKPAKTPLEQNHKLALAMGPILKDPALYMRLVGRLIYLTITCPELSYCVHILGQFMQHPKQDHLAAALRVVCYLKGNPGHDIFLSAHCDMKLYGYCDSD
ncbi:Retrovirus-related Pol polyprotein from transposon RE1 [Vitis vinifera]|uniref:Retrovirus-related Pol polyprotein from transposon RE1 n=1 Tax=Vitis vinifera TaxID=29760 RepID=A0A438INP6_VITVI|nr:Retrovirus-related Pol polyprotein from transposon RE1 [Vitis vinifera]